MKGIAEQKLRRFQFLKYLYERTGGSETELVPDDEAMQARVSESAISIWCAITC